MLKLKGLSSSASEYEKLGSGVLKFEGVRSGDRLEDRVTHQGRVKVGATLRRRSPQSFNDQAAGITSNSDRECAVARELSC